MGKEDFPRAQRLGTNIPPPCPFVGQSLSGGLSGPEDSGFLPHSRADSLAGWPLGDEGET